MRINIIPIQSAVHFDFRFFGRAGAVLQGARLKEGLTQTDLSKMERGKRTIGKQMAHRLAKVLKVDYRVFL